MRKNRKEYPIFSGVIKYFPKAIWEVSNVSYLGHKKHNPKDLMQWDKTKSSDELDALMRHLTDYASGEIYDEDGVRHLARVAWRALAMLERQLDGNNKD